MLRIAPCLFALFSVVTLIYHEHLKRHRVRLIQRPGYKKAEPTFADALATVRELFWTETVFAQPPFRRVWKKRQPNCVVSSWHTCAKRSEATPCVA